jgi:hypothetical protein
VRGGLRPALLLFALVVAGAAASACGSGDNASTPSQAAATSTGIEKTAYDKKLEADWSSYRAALAEVSATCPVPKVTLKTMRECKSTSLALIKVADADIADLAVGTPAKLEQPIGHLTDSLTGIHDAFTALVGVIDAKDLAGFNNSGGPGSAIDNAIEGCNAARTEIVGVESTLNLPATVF